jgi:hypothetical protein
MAKMGCAKCGKSMSKGGVKKYAAGGSTLSGSAIKKAPVQLYGMPQENMGTSGQYGQMKKGGAMSKINRAVKPGCRGGMVKDANGNLAQMNVAKSVNDLDKVKKGDIFVVEHAQAIAVGLTAAGKDAKPGVSGVRSVTVAGKGSAKPFEEITDTVYATVKISTIDTKTRIVTFTMPNGEKQKVKVDKAILGLEKFKAGDDVIVEFVDDTAIGFVTPKK